MNAAEALARSTAAAKRVAEVNPYAGLVMAGLTFAAWFFRGFVWLCVGFGGAAALNVSAWWGLPAAMLVAQTVGRLWEWLRRDSRVRAYEKAADDLEVDAGLKPGPRAVAR